jgi:peptide deformylase
MLKLVKFPDPILRQSMPDFDFTDPIMDPIELEKAMLAVMFEHDGIGLAANQVGIVARVFVMGHRVNSEAAQAFFNPEIIANTEEIVDMEEVNVWDPCAVKL